MREQNFRGVVHAAQPVVEHLEHADLERCAEAVLDAAQDAVDVVAVAFELQDDIDDVLEDLRAGDGPVLGDVADDDDRRSGRFGVFEQGGGAFADLRHAAGRRVDLLGVDRLDRVDDHQVGPLLGDLCDDVFEQRLGVDQTLLVADPDAGCAHLDLLGRLLARDVERSEPVCREGDLEREGRFPDSRFAAQQHERPGHHAAAQHPVHLRVAQVEPAVFAFADVGHALGPAFGQRSADGCRHLAAPARDDLLGEGVPLSAARALAEPFRRLESAVAAEVGFLDLCHRRLRDQ